jgi:hypothetical protein
MKAPGNRRADSFAASVATPRALAAFTVTSGVFSA